jgi:glycosyltransferase involved in cell wall biosynthesis
VNGHRHPVADEASKAETARYRVLVTCGVFEPGFRGGGPVRSVAQIVDTVSEHIDVVLLTSDRDLGAAEPYPGLSGRWIDRNRARVFYLNPRALRHWFQMWRDLRQIPFDLLYVNSLWSPVFTVVPILAARLRLIRVRKVLIAPRGELSPGALSLKARKKRLFLRWWGSVLRRMGIVWHASAEREAAEVRAVCPWADIEVNLDEVALPEDPLPPVTNEGTARLVFISRICAKKNLQLALWALREVPPPVEFDIYGPVEDPAYWSRCQAIIDVLPCTVRVRYRGELAPALVPPSFSGYDAFVFPTLGENFGHVIAESLSASCPVICSDTTPWTEILDAGGGTVVRDLTSEAFGKALANVVGQTPAERLRAREAAGAAFSAWRKAVSRANVLDLVRERR